jgi:hypothetical protein
VAAVVIGMDPHKRSATIEVMAGDESVLDGGRFATDADGYAAMLRFAKRFAERTWAIEGCQGIGVLRRHRCERRRIHSADREQIRTPGGPNGGGPDPRSESGPLR